MKVGVFETFRSYPGGVLWRFDEHWLRWGRSAELCGFVLPVDKQVVENMITEVLSGSPEVRLRLWSDGVDWELEVSPLPENPKTVLIEDQCFSRANPAAKHDGHDYASFYKPQVFDTIWFDADNQLLEGNISNVFVVIDGQLCTPPLSGILPGLMRSWIMSAYPVIERVITREELLKADEIMLTNMLRGVVSVDRWDKWRPKDLGVAAELRANMTCQIEAPT